MDNVQRSSTTILSFSATALSNAAAALLFLKQNP